MVTKRGIRRGGDARGLWKLVPLPEKPTVDQMLAASREQTKAFYHARPDLLFRGMWRAEPIGYGGRGAVFLFKGEMAKYEAMGFAKVWNRRAAARQKEDSSETR
jgi:hypothetical protein